MRKMLLAGVVALLLSPSAIFAQDTTALVHLLEGVKTLDTQFEQVMLDRDETRLQTSSGHMWVQRPRQFRWHATEPFEQLVVSDGNKVWIHDVDLEQVIERPLGNEIGETPALLLSGDSTMIANEFTVKKIREQGKSVTFQLTPKDDEQMFDVLEMSFEGKTPTSMRLEDSLGQKTSFNFIKPKLNGRIKADRFTFNIPEGVDVIRDEE
ncbi:MAG TPA: outer membrane lipoprotein chaperone LolA [Alcanivoracaceae bacterium]|nr:outer membrane lipoprotein chaperone LolA [Alcanivoracaceae bacterium]